MVSGGKLAQTRGCGGCNMRASDVVSVTWRQLPLFICAERPIPATLRSNDDHEIFITELQTCCYDLLATGLPCANRQTDRLAQTLVCKAAVRPMRGFVGVSGL